MRRETIRDIAALGLLLAFGPMANGTGAADSLVNGSYDAHDNITSAQTTYEQMLAYHKANPDAGPIVPPYLEGPGPGIVPFAVVPERATVVDPNRPDVRRDKEAGGERAVQTTGSNRVGVTDHSGLAPAILAPPLSTSFQGVVDNDTRIPPDTMGAVGPSHVVELLNSGFTVFDRTGAVVAPQISLAAFWSSLGEAVADRSFDPKVLFDQQSDRWVVISDTNAFLPGASVLVGISAGNDPTGAWNLFAIDADPGNTTWADFPGLGVDTANIYVSNNMFTTMGGFFSNAKFWVIEKASMMAGGPLNLSAILEVDKDGFTYQPCHSFDNVPGGLNYVVDEGWCEGGPCALRFLNIQQFTGVGAAATLTNLGFIEVATYNIFQSDAPQPMCATGIETNDTRLLNAVVRMDTIWTTHSVANASGKTEVAWYELDPSLANPDGSNGPNQQGRVSDPSLFYYFPSIAVNRDKCVALGFSGSDASTFVSGYFTVHFPASPPGVTEPVGLLHAGVAPYWKKFSGDLNRWGDYSHTVVDPLDDRTFWTVQEYAEFQFAPSVPGDSCVLNRGKWATWWGSFRCCPDSDGDVDLDDYALFATCLTAPCGPGGCEPPLYSDECCAPADLDADGDVDLVDVAAFQIVFTGP